MQRALNPAHGINATTHAFYETGRNPKAICGYVTALHVRAARERALHAVEDLTPRAPQAHPPLR